MNNKEELNNYITELSQRKPVRFFKNDKGYDRAKDRKDKRLYEVDLEDEDGIIEEGQSIL